MGSRQWVGQKAPEAIICLPANNSTVCPLFAYSLPTVCLLCGLYVPTVCGLFAYCVLSFYLRFGTEKKAYSLYSSQEPFIHYLLCSAPCCRKTRADVGIKYLPTNQFVFRLFSLLFFEEKKTVSPAQTV